MRMEETDGPGFKELKLMLAGLSDCSVDVGWFESAVYPNGTHVAHVAAIQEFGYRSIPPRPFMRPTITAKTEAWKAKLVILTKALSSGKTMSQVLTTFGAVVESDIAKTITEVTSPPLKPSTIAKRFKSKKGGRSVKPLVDTRYMFNSLTSVVKNK
jgi:hypothetical protein